MGAMKLRLTPEDLAEILDRTINTIHFWIRYKDLGEYGEKNNRRWYFTYEGVQRFLKENAANWMTKSEWDRCMQRLRRSWEQEGR